MKRFSRWLAIACISFASAFASASALQVNQNGVKGIAQAYGFVVGQEASLEMVQKGHPDLSMKVKMSKAAFDAGFPP